MSGSKGQMSGQVLSSLLRPEVDTNKARSCLGVAARRPKQESRSETRREGTNKGSLPTYGCWSSILWKPQETLQGAGKALRAISREAGGHVFIQQLLSLLDEGCSRPSPLPETSCVVAKESHRIGHRDRWPGVRGCVQRWGMVCGWGLRMWAPVVHGQTLPDKTPSSSVGLPPLSSVCLRILES